MQFTQDEEERKQNEVPYFEDVTSQDGWAGQTTTKSIEELKSEITTSITRLGGYVTAIKKGKFVSDEHFRDGFVIEYQIPGKDGTLYPGKIDIAALPLRQVTETKRIKSLKMALYMFNVSLKGTWFLQKLSPGYDPLMPFMLAGKDGKTVSQLWSESSVFYGQLLPPADDVVDGTYTEK